MFSGLPQSSLLSLCDVPAYAHRENVRVLGEYAVINGQVSCNIIEFYMIGGI